MPTSQETLQNILAHWSLGDNATPLGWVYAVDVRSTANLTLSGAQTIDTVGVVDGQYVLAMNQATGAENGVYQVKAGAWKRIDDGLGGPALRSKAYCWVASGGTWPNTLYSVTTADPITVGSTSIAWGAVTPGGGGASDHKVLQSATDTTAAYLGAKLHQGTNITLTVLNPGANETIDIAAAAATSDHKVSIDGSDTTSDYLNAKLTVTAPMTKTVVGEPGPGTLNLATPVFVASGAGHASGLVPDPGAGGTTTKYLREDASWQVPPTGSTNQGSTTVDFGAFPGGTMATVTITGQTGILTTSVIRAWIPGKGTPGGYTADEHVIASTLVDVVCSDIVAGTGFTIYVMCRDMGGSPLMPPGIGRNQVANATAGRNYTMTPTVVGTVGGKTINVLWGTYNVDWSWS